jgi:hypothetical protein
MDMMIIHSIQALVNEGELCLANFSHIVVDTYTWVNNIPTNGSPLVTNGHPHSPSISCRMRSQFPLSCGNVVGIFFIVFIVKNGDSSIVEMKTIGLARNDESLCYLQSLLLVKDYWTAFHHNAIISTKHLRMSTGELPAVRSVFKPKLHRSQPNSLFIRSPHSQ